MSADIPSRFDAFRIHQSREGHRAGVEQVALADLTDGDVTLRVEWSSVNYKDALAGTGAGRILRTSPLVGGIDMAGHVVETRSAAFREGDAVLATGCGLSEVRDGGFSTYARLSADAVIPLPAGLTTREAMSIGTAGFTAALALHRMVVNGQTPDMGPLAVTGASGGVGMLAIDVLSGAGFEVVAVSGKPQHADGLTAVGAAEVLGRDALLADAPLEAATLGGGLDNAGGALLAGLLARTVPHGCVVSAGLAASSELRASVMPFILRGVSLLGVTSSNTPRPLREHLWQRLADDWKPRHLSRIVTREVGLEGLRDVFDTMLAGHSFGRTLVRL